MARNAELEAQLADHPDDLQTWEVYADWLQRHGDPRGELAAVAMRAQATRDPKLSLIRDAIQRRIGPALYGGLGEVFGMAGDLPRGLTWRHGFVAQAMFDQAQLGMPLADAVRAALAEDACALARDIALRDAHGSLAAGIEALGEIAPRAVKTVTLTSGVEIASLAPLATLHLERLSLGTTAPTAIQDIARAPWPLSWLNFELAADADTARGPLGELFSRVPTLRTLHVRGVGRDTALGGTLVGALVDSPLAARLESLVLMLPLPRASNELLLREIGRFANLRAISVPGRTYNERLQRAIGM